MIARRDKRKPAPRTPGGTSGGTVGSSESTVCEPVVFDTGTFTSDSCSGGNDGGSAACSAE